MQNTICCFLLKWNIYWQTEALNLWTYSIHSCHNTVHYIPASFYWHQDKKTVLHFQKILPFCLISFVPLADLHLSDIWTWSSFWITSCTLSARSTRHFAFFCNVCSIFNTDHHFCLNMCSQLFWLQCSFSRFQSRFQALKCFTN